MTIERRARTLPGNCLEVLAGLEADSVDAVVTDPPYGLGFMGKQWDTPGAFVQRRAEPKNAWDHVGGNHNPTDAADAARTRRVEGRRYQEFCEDWATAVLRVLKPGGHMLAFGGTRTYHRLTVAIESAGFEVRDCLMWLYGSGFPKSLDVSKAIDKAAGEQRERIRGVGSGVVNTTYAQDAWSKEYKDSVLSAEPLTDAARRWQGWGTALKPAYEPIVLARKPLVGTVAANVQEYGTGAINVDACRIPTNGETPSGSGDRTNGRIYAQDESQTKMANGGNVTPPSGRWPANVIHDGSAEVVGLFPQTTSGTRKAGDYTIAGGRGVYGEYHSGEMPAIEGNTGSAARFFYTAKASRRERGEGNTHPTVKPLALMRYLCKLITPPGGLILDPFAGSGSTGVAAVREGFRFLGIDQDDASVRTADRRTIDMEFLPLERFLVDE